MFAPNYFCQHARFIAVRHSEVVVPSHSGPKGRIKLCWVQVWNMSAQCCGAECVNHWCGRAASRTAAGPRMGAARPFIGGDVAMVAEQGRQGRSKSGTTAPRTGAARRKPSILPFKCLRGRFIAGFSLNSLFFYAGAWCLDHRCVHSASRYVSAWNPE